MPKVVTANRLDDGVVVFLDSDNRWSEQLHDARAFNGELADSAIEQQVESFASPEAVVSVYVMAVELIDGLLNPVSVREQIRAAHRPTI